MRRSVRGISRRGSLPSVVEPVRWHVEAKRYLVATDPVYLDVLSEASIATLHQQGGACTPDEAAAFEAREYAAAAVAFRRWDDAGKASRPRHAPARRRIGRSWTHTSCHR